MPTSPGEHRVERLDVSPRLLESIVSSVGDAILVTEARPIDGPGPKIVYANESFTRMTGYTAEEIIGKTPRILQGIGTDRNRLDEIRAALTQREPVRVELLNYRKDGTEFRVEIDIMPVADKQGNHTHWVSVQRDVTERRQQQKALRESEERLRTILAQYSSDMITILDPDGTIRFQSPAVADTLGYLTEEIVGENIFDYLHPEDVELVAGRFAALLDDPGSSRPMEVRIRHADGSWRWFEGIGSNLVDNPGVGGIVVNSRDIARRKEAEENLAEAERHYRTLVEQVPAIIYLHEPTPAHQPANYDYEVAYISPRVEEVLGYSAHEFLQNRALWNEIVHPDDRAKVIAEDERTDASGDPFLMEYRMVRRDGREVWIREEAFLIHGPEGKPLYWQGVMTDVTEQKLAEQRLRLLESVAVNANDAVLIADAWPVEEPGPRIVYANEAFTSMTGYSSDEIVGETPRLLQGEKTDREQLDEIHHALSHWEPVRVEILNYRKDGTEFWVELDISPAADESGRIIHWVAVQRETTGRRLVEEKLRKSEADLKRAERIALLGNWEWNPISGELSWSDEVFRIFGFTPGEFVPTFSKFTEAVHPEDRERLPGVINDAMNRGAPFDLEHRLICPDGEERIVRCRGEVERDEDGEPTLMFGSLQDVTEQRLAAQALEGSERRFRSVVQNSSEIIKITDAEGMLQYASPAFGRIFGYDPEEAMGTNVLDYIHPDDLPRVQQETEDALQSPGVASNVVEYRFRHADGTWRWVESVGTYLLDDPAVNGVVVNVRDVTERKQAVERIRNAEERYRTLVEQMPAVIYIQKPLHGRRASYEVSYMSPRVEEILGYPEQSFIEDRDFWNKLIHPDDLAEVLAEDERTDESGDSFLMEYRMFHRDGRVVWIRDEAELIRVPEGDPLYWQGVMTDVTGRRQAQDALRESEERYRSVAENVREVIFQTTAEGNYTFLNPAWEEITGFTVEESLGNSYLEYIHPDDLQRNLEDLEQMGSHGDDYTGYEARFLAKDGSLREVEIKFQEHFDESGNLTGTSGTINDITERKNKERELQESEQRFRQLFEQSVDAVYVHDEEGRFVDCNAQSCRILGYTREELLSMSVADISSNVLTAEERARQEEEDGALWQRIMDGEPGVFSQGHEEENIRKDGTTFPVEVRIGSVDYGGQRMVLASVRNITERKQAEEALRQSEERFRGAFENASTGVALVGLDNRYLRVNHALCEMLGYSEEELLSKESFDITHPEDKVRSQTRAGWMLQEGGSEAVSTEKRYLKKDGGVVWAISDVSLVRDSEGNPSHFISHFQDITRRKRDEKALEESEQRLKAVAAGAPVIMFAIDSEGVFTFESGAALRDLGLEPGTNMGCSVFETYTNFPKVLDNVRQALAGEDVVDTVEIGERAYHATYSPQFDKNGNVYEIIGVATDVTERWRLERDMEHWATHDSLTGLTNRRLLFARLADTLDRTERRGESICLLFADLNGFKEVNDRHGHEAGDALLAAVAGRIEGCLRSSDTAARVGGDEFCILLEPSGTEEAVRIAKRLVASLETPFSVGTSADTSTVGISTSIGIAVKDKDSGSRSPDELMREADAAMYRAKNRGGQFYEVVELKNTG